MAGASERSIVNQTGHRSIQMVARHIRAQGEQCWEVRTVRNAIPLSGRMLHADGHCDITVDRLNTLVNPICAQL